MNRNLLLAALLAVPVVSLAADVTKQKVDQSFCQLLDQLNSEHYDQNRVAGGLFHKIASLFVNVKRGTLTPKGFQLLEQWAKNKSAEELKKCLKVTRELLQDLLGDPAPTSREKNILQAVKVRLYYLQEKKEKENS